MKETILEPCPFCGGELKIIECTRFHSGYDLICMNEREEDDKHKTVTSCPLGGFGFLNKDKLIKMANTRPIEDILRSEIKYLKQKTT